MPDDERSYWDQRWREGDTGWDISSVSPPLQRYFEQLPDRSISILIPGCGNAWEAAWLLDNGFTDITVLDISASLTQRLREELADTPIKIINADFFQHQAQYDLIVEQTFFCAIDPSQRPAYVDKAHELLNPGGKLAGLLFDRNFVGASSLAPPRSFPSPGSGIPCGPPYGGHKVEYQRLLEKRFALKTLEPCYNSIKPRAGTELFFIAIRKAPAD